MFFKMEKECVNLCDMNERQLLFERIKHDTGKSQFTNKEINDEAYKRMKDWANNNDKQDFLNLREKLWNKSYWCPRCSENMHVVRFEDIDEVLKIAKQECMNYEDDILSEGFLMYIWTQYFDQDEDAKFQALIKDINKKIKEVIKSSKQGNKNG